MHDRQRLPEQQRVRRVCRLHRRQPAHQLQPRHRPGLGAVLRALHQLRRARGHRGDRAVQPRCAAAPASPLTAAHAPCRQRCSGLQRSWPARAHTRGSCAKTFPCDILLKHAPPGLLAACCGRPCKYSSNRACAPPRRVQRRQRRQLRRGRRLRRQGHLPACVPVQQHHAHAHVRLVLRLLPGARPCSGGASTGYLGLLGLGY